MNRYTLRDFGSTFDGCQLFRNSVGDVVWLLSMLSADVPFSGSRSWPPNWPSLISVAGATEAKRHPSRTGKPSGRNLSTQTLGGTFSAHACQVVPFVTKQSPRCVETPELVDAACIIAMRHCTVFVTPTGHLLRGQSEHL